MRWSVAAWGGAALLAVAGCGGDRRAAPPATAAASRVPPLCGHLPTQVLGRVGAPAAELSGLVRSSSGGFWAHNDSGDEPRIFELRRDGSVRREVAVGGAEHVDWEDIAIRGRTLYIGDIGDNLAQRPEIAVYRMRETSTVAEKITLRYPDGAHDAEALLVDPSDGTIVIVTKDLGGSARVYSGRPLRHRATLELGLGQPITAGDASAGTIVLRSYDRAFIWTRRAGEPIARALRRKPCVANLAAEGQGEALALSRDGRAFWTAPEGPRPLLRRYG
jgi:hypothetical protein